jgi:hypothetical protein
LHGVAYKKKICDAQYDDEIRSSTQRNCIVVWNKK